MARSTQHTRGPWEVQKVEWRHSATGNTERQFVIEKRYPGNLTDEIALVVRHVKPESQQEADARLIAKSPDLLDALETLIADIDSARSLNEFIIGERANRLEGARALVAEIEGGA